MYDTNCSKKLQDLNYHLLFFSLGPLFKRACRLYGCLYKTICPGINGISEVPMPPHMIINTIIAISMVITFWRIWN